MDFLKRLLGRNTNTKYKYRGAKLPKEPLTPREIEEMHRKLYPFTHVDKGEELKSILDTSTWSVPYTRSLEETLPTIDLLYQAQSKSLLFRKLPLEVRMQIWRLVMANHKVHLTAHRGRMRQHMFESEGYQWLPQRGLLKIPLVCRAAYMESISYLYSDNTFCFGFGATSYKAALTSLDAILPKQHIASMQHIEVGWHLYAGVSQYYDSHPQAWDFTLDVPAPETETHWYDVCTELVKLSHLRTLRIVVWLSGDRRGQFVEREKDLLAPLLVMGHLDRFDIHLPWKQSDPELWNDAPFSVSRRFRVKEMYGVSVPLLDDDFYWSGSAAQHRIYSSFTSRGTAP
ncbi:hypothetical protein FNAPI_726 [Fusarium napiforme]|uniref:DUF7730 domain-containing protein n=1 Tax=Fusarium napiforme TaxID=42672 RepID=A0A8H5NI53_9HYPO|nr:hypothetical protein FNAPI_726 [Fusarium napiforme]